MSPLLLAVTIWAVALVGQTQTETFKATASVKTGAASAAADVSITVYRYATDKDRAAIKTALTKGGTTAAQTALLGMNDAGFIQLGERRTALKFITSRPTPGGQIVVAVTAEPIFFLGAGVPGAKKQEGFDVAVAILEVKDGNPGKGELAPAAKIKLDANDALVIDDYGPTIMWLNDIVRAR
jgi:hypothetical protein